MSAIAAAKAAKNVRYGGMIITGVADGAAERIRRP
jgi:hypothetical protein